MLRIFHQNFGPVVRNIYVETKKQYSYKKVYTHNTMNLKISQFLKLLSKEIVVLPIHVFYERFMTIMEFIILH